MKVLVFTTVYPSPTRPTHGIFVEERIRRLAKHCEVRVVAPHPWFKSAVPHRECRHGVDVYHPVFWYLPLLLKFIDGFFLFMSSLACVARLRREFDFDLIDAHFAYPDGVAASWLAWWFAKPFVITERGTLRYHADKRLHRRAIRRAFARAARIIAVSHDLGDRVKALGVPANRLEIIANGVDTQRFRPSEPALARQLLGLPPKGRLLVSVGNLSHRKGFQRVLRVLPGLLREFPDLTFTVVGGPGAARHNLRELQRLIGELGLEGKANLAGPKLPHEVSLWLNAADLFVLATDFEGCPNVVNEALACGLPVVVSRVGEVEYMVPEGAGLLIDDPEDLQVLAARLREALERPWDRAAIRAAVEGRTWEAVADRVLEQWRMAVEPPVTAPISRSRNREFTGMAALGRPHGDVHGLGTINETNHGSDECSERSQGTSGEQCLRSDNL